VDLLEPVELIYVADPLEGAHPRRKLLLVVDQQRTFASGPRRVRRRTDPLEDGQRPREFPRVFGSDAARASRLRLQGLLLVKLRLCNQRAGDVGS